MLKDGLKAFNWMTDRIDQVSAYLKKKKRTSYVQKVDAAVSSGDDDFITNELRKINENAEDRKNQ